MKVICKETFHKVIRDNVYIVSDTTQKEYAFEIGGEFFSYPKCYFSEIKDEATTKFIFNTEIYYIIVIEDKNRIIICNDNHTIYLLPVGNINDYYNQLLMEPRTLKKIMKRETTILNLDEL